MAFKKVAVNYNLPKQIAEEIKNKRYEISKNWNERWNNANPSVRNSMAAAVVRPIVDKYKEELRDKDLVQAIYKILEDDNFHTENKIFYELTARIKANKNIKSNFSNDIDNMPVGESFVIIYQSEIGSQEAGYLKAPEGGYSGGYEPESDINTAAKFKNLQEARKIMEDEIGNADMSELSYIEIKKIG